MRRGFSGSSRRSARRAAGRIPSLSRRLRLELLEPRQMLCVGGVCISEFMAANSSTLLDFEGDSSDWIELHNISAATVDLDGWYLTDDAANLTKWQFPNVAASEFVAGEYDFLFASSKSGDPLIPVDELHTNFKLAKSGEYLALVMPDGMTIAHEYAPEFPKQLVGVSYGISETILLADTLVGTTALAKVLVPNDDALGLTWTNPSFDDSSWTEGPLGIGFDAVIDYATIDIGLTGQQVESGAESVSDSGNDVNLPATGLTAVGGDPFTIAIDNVNAAGVAVGGIDWRDRGDNGSSDPLVKLGEDFVKNNEGIIRVTLGSLPSGTYDVISTHIDASNSQSGNILVFVTDALGINVQQLATGDASFDPGGVGGLTTPIIENTQATFTVVSNGTDDVIIYFDGTAAAAKEVEWRWNQDGPSAAADGSGTWTSEPIDVHSFDPSHPDDGHTVQFTAAMDVPTFTQNDTLSGSDVFPTNSPGNGSIGTVGFGNESGGSSGNRPFDDGVSWVWPTYTATDTVTLTATHMGTPYTWDVTTVMQSENAGDDNTSQAIYDAEIYDNVAGGGDDAVLLQHRIAGWFGVPGQNHRKSGDRNDFLIGQDQFFTDRVTTASTNSSGAGIGAMLAFRSTLNTVYFGDVLIGGSIFGDIADIASFDKEVPLNGLKLIRQSIPYAGLISTDIETEMLGINPSAYLRVPFVVAPSTNYTALSLEVRYDDGFVAYLNGVEVAQRNAPAMPLFDATATASHPNQQAIVAEVIDLTPFLGALVEGGNNVLAIHGLDFVVDGDNDFLIGAALFANRSETGDIEYFTTPTPGLANVTGAQGVVADTKFSVDRGFFYESFQVEITSDTPGAEIRYTTDASEPTATTGTVYMSPIGISSTTTLRAAAFKPGFLATNVDTQTYLFLEDVLQQSEAFGWDGTGLPPFPTWGHEHQNHGHNNQADHPTGGSGDWEVDPDIVNHADIENRLSTSDLRAIPTLSMVLPWDDMFGDDGQGIYIDGSGVERAMSLEQIMPDGSSGFQINGSVRIFGGTSPNRWKTDRLQMMLKFKEEFGPTKLNSAIFGPEATDSFDTIILDGQMNHSWTYSGNSTPTFQRDNAKYIQDQHVANLQQAMGGFAPAAKYHHLYINGLYWGDYYVHERPDASFAAAYLGGDKDDYDIIKHDQGEVVSGFPDSYDDLIDLSRLDLTNDTNYQNVTDVLDVEDFIDYILVNFYIGNTDWAHHNWYASFNRVDPSGKWRFHSWDAEVILKSVTEDVTGKNNSGGPTEIHQNLRANAEYNLLFADRVQRHFFHEGVLTPENSAAEYQKLMDEIDRSIVGESARWGDNNGIGGDVNNPYTRDSWLAVQNDLLNNYFPLRTDIVLTQLRVDGLFPSTSADAPNFLIEGSPQHGGEIQAGDDLTFSSLAGTVWYTLDGTDPRDASTDNPSGSALSASPVTLNASTQVRARLLTGGEWSALQESFFSVETLATQQQLAITEIHYHPADPSVDELVSDPLLSSSDFEFLELTNTSAGPINLAGMEFTAGVGYEFLADTTSILAAGERLLIVNDLIAFELRYGTSLNVVGEFSGNLNNGGEQLRLRNYQGDIELDFKYSDGRRWPEQADGIGASLVLLDPLDSYSDTENWRASSEFHGSPGVPGNDPVADIIVNEVLSHSDGINPDLIELHNLSASPIDVSGWAISDQKGNLFRGTLPLGSIISPGGYTVFDQSEFGFGLDNDRGEHLWLIETDPGTGALLRFADVVEFEGAQTEVSLGRWNNGDPAAPLVSMASQTFGSPNSGPLADTVRITELFYNAAWFKQNFTDGTASGFNPLQGNFSVVDGTYIGLPTAFDPLAVLDPVITLPSVFEIEADILVPVTTAFDRNAAILFDYQSSTNFKFALLDADAGRWQLGQRTGGTWNVLAEAAEKLVPGREYDMTVEVHATEARLLVEGVEKLRWDYSNDLADGNIGVSSNNGEFVLDRFQVDPLDDGEFEFVELHNPTAAPIDISDWRLDDAVDFTFSFGTTIGAGETLVVAGFNPADAIALATFQTRFGIDGTVLVVGGYQGRLDNAGETILLTRPVDPFSPLEGHLVVDGVPYEDQPPWPTAADDGNQSLHLDSLADFGSDATSWQAGAPTPGTVDLTPPQPGDADGDGDVDDADLFAWEGGYGTSTGADVSIGDFDFNGGVDGSDFLIWQRNFGADLTPPQPGDADGDGDVDAEDLLAWEGGYGTSTGADVSIGDFDFNGGVDGSDFLIWQRNFGAVPAPSSALETPALSPAVVSVAAYEEPTPVAVSLAPSQPENANSDGAVNGDDFRTWQDRLDISMAVTGLIGDLHVDMVVDGATDGDDSLLWQSNLFVEQGFGTVSESPTSQPATSSSLRSGAENETSMRTSRLAIVDTVFTELGDALGDRDQLAFQRSS